LTTSYLHECGWLSLFLAWEADTLTAMNSELIEIASPIACAFFLGVVIFMVSRWSRKKSEEFRKTEAVKTQRSSQDGQPILNQLTPKETWDKLEAGMSSHGLRPDNANAIRSDEIGPLGAVPLIITTLIAIFMVFLYVFN